MKAKEIRDEFGGSQNPEQALLAEIAAQLAELNENYDDFKKSFTSTGCIDVYVRTG